MGIKADLIKYIDAGYPIIYINSFEESKADSIIKEAMGGREGLEWNGSHGYVDFENKRSLMSNQTLAQTLTMLSNHGELDRKYLVLKDAHLLFDDYVVISSLKNIALQISQGLDAVVIIVSPVTRIPKELEKFITILEIEYKSF